MTPKGTSIKPVLTLREQRIFMPPEITKQFRDVIERMSHVEVQRRIALEFPDAVHRFEDSTDWQGDCVSVFEDMAAKANRSCSATNATRHVIGDAQQRAGPAHSTTDHAARRPRAAHLA
jgi:hypothetical protein